MNNKHMIRRALISLLTLALLLAAPAALAQGTGSSDSNNQNPPDNPWYANSDGAYTVSLGTGALISLYPQTRGDQPLQNGEYAEGAQPPSARRDYKYQFFYGGSVESVYTNNVGSAIPGGSSELYSTSIEPYVALFLPTRTGRF